MAKGFGAKKSLGQNFLVSEEIAALEAKYSKGLSVVELGPGLGILTRELCKSAKRVVAIERDTRLIELLKMEIKSKKLELLNSDFFEIDIEKIKPIDIMISNIPYNLSSKTIYWLGLNQIPALVCVQKEFADHIFAEPGSRSYSKLSVVCSLEFRMHHVKEVSAGNFYPKPRVDSSIIYLIPKHNPIDEAYMEILSMIMNHKKKTLRNSIIDSSDGFGISKKVAKELADLIPNNALRTFKMSPQEILEVSKHIHLSLQGMKNQKE